MSLRPILCNFVSIVAFQHLLLRGFERLVFRSPTVLKKSLGTWAFRLHCFDIDSQRRIRTDVSEQACDL